MPVHLYRYGTPRQPGEGVRIGVARRAPVGVRREDRARKGWFDSWLPLLAPPDALAADYAERRISAADFTRGYRAAMEHSAPCRQVIRLLAAFARTAPVSLGCFCRDEKSCHRSILRELVLKNLPPGTHPPEPDAGTVERYASPVCLSAWAENGLL